MNMKPVADAVQKGCAKVIKESPKIFAAAAIVGTVGTAVLAVKATPKALLLLEGKKEQVGRPVLTKREIIATTWKCYIPAFASGLITIACIAAGQSIQAHRNAQLLVAYGLSETARRLYSERVRVELGPDHENAIKVDAAISQMRNQPITKDILIPLDDNTNIELAPKDEIVRCYDYISSREFFASQNQIEEIVNKFNENEMEVFGRSSLNVLYSYFDNKNLAQADIYEMLGWQYKDGQGVTPICTPHLDQGRLMLVVDYFPPPTYDF